MGDDSLIQSILLSLRDDHNVAERCAEGEDVCSRSSGDGCGCRPGGRTLVKDGGFWVCKECGVCVRCVQECNIDETKQKDRVKNASDLFAENETQPLVAVQPSVPPGIKCFGCLVGSARHCRILESAASGFLVLLEGIRESKVEWIKQISASKRCVTVALERLQLESANSQIDALTCDDLVRESTCIAGLLEKLTRKSSKQILHPQLTSDDKDKRSVMKRVCNELNAIASERPFCKRAASRLETLNTGLNSLLVRMQSWGRPARNFIAFVASGRKDHALVSLEQNKKLEIHLATKRQTVCEEFIRCVEDESGAGGRIATLMGSLKNIGDEDEFETIADTLGSIDESAFCAFNACMKVRFRHKDVWRRTTMCYCCNNIACHGLMGIGFVTTTDAPLMPLLQERGQFLSRWLPNRHVVRRQSRDIDSVFCIEMRLLGAFKHLTPQPCFDPAVIGTDFLEKQAKDAFFRSNFFSYRLNMTLAVITILLQTRDFYLRGVEHELSVSAAAIVVGFWDKYFKAAFCHANSSFRTFNALLMEGRSDMVRDRGNPETDAIVLLRRLQWKQLVKTTTLHVSQPMRVPNSSVIVDVPCMPPQFTTRSIAALDRCVSSHLRDRSCSVKAFYSNLKINRELTISDFDEIRRALQSNMLGLSPAHADETLIARGENSGVPSHLRTAVPRKAEAVSTNFSANDFGIKTSSNASLLARVHSSSQRLAMVLSRAWTDVGIFDSDVAEYPAERLAVGLVVALDGTSYPELPDTVPVNEGNDIVYRDINDPLQHRSATPLGKGGSNLQTRLRECITMECNLSRLVHGTRKDGYMAIGMPLNYANKQQIETLALRACIHDVATFTTTAKLVRALVRTECIRYTIRFVDSLILKVVEIYHTTDFGAFETDRAVMVDVSQQFTSEGGQRRASLLNTEISLRVPVSPPTRRTGANSLLTTLISTTDSCCDILSIIIGDCWPSMMGLNWEAMAPNVDASQTLKGWRQFIDNFPVGGRPVVPPSSYETLIFELHRFEHRCRELFPLARKRGVNDPVWTSEQSLILWNHLSCLYDKIASFSKRTANTMTQYAMNDPRVVPEEAKLSGPMASLSQQLLQDAKATWEKLLCSGSTEVSIAEELELAAVGRVATNGDDMPLGFAVYNTTGILRHILYNPADAQKHFDSCYKRVYCGCSLELTCSEKEMSKRMFSEMHAVVVQLGILKKHYASVGQFHRNRVSVEFLCSLAINEGTAHEKAVAIKIIQSGFCFLTCTFGLYSSVFLKSMFDQSSGDWYGHVRKSGPMIPTDSAMRQRGRVEASYTLEEAEEYMLRRARTQTFGGLHHSRRVPAINEFSDDMQSDAALYPPSDKMGFFVDERAFFEDGTATHDTQEHDIDTAHTPPNPDILRDRVGRRLACDD